HRGAGAGVPVVLPAQRTDRHAPAAGRRAGRLLGGPGGGPADPAHRRCLRGDRGAALPRLPAAHPRPYVRAPGPARHGSGLRPATTAPEGGLRQGPGPPFGNLGPVTTPQISIPDGLLPTDGRFGAGPSKVRPAQLEALVATGRTYLGTSHRQA